MDLMNKIPDEVGTLVFLFREKNILLAKKKRGFAKGTWNGYGGKVNLGESVREAALRELQEESGINQAKLEPVGVLHFYEPSFYILCHVFFCKNFAGEPKETAEMKPVWFPITQLPYEEMWVDDIHWLPYALDGNFKSGEIWFTKNWEKVLKHKIKLRK